MQWVKSIKEFKKGLLFIAVFFCDDSLHAQSWKLVNDSAVIFKEQKDIDRAIEYYIRAKRLLPKDSLVTDTHINITSGIATLLYTAKSQYAKAEIFYLEARKLIKKKYGIETDNYAANANVLGQVYYFLRKYTEAEKFYTEAKQIWERLHGKNSKEYAGSCNALGILYNDNRQFDKAEAQHLEARAIREKLFTRENGSYAQSCNNLAAIYWNLGQYDLAEPLALEAKEIRGRVAGIPKSAYAISCVNLGNIYRDMGKYQLAEALYIEARNVREIFFTKEHDDYALSCDILADLYYFMKQFGKAETLYLEAKGIREKISPVKGYFYGQSCSSLSALYREMGEYAKAESLALEADTIWQGLGTAAAGDLAINNNNLGSLYFTTGDFNKAEQYFFKARKTWGESLGEAHPFYTENSLNLARVYWGKNEIVKANDLYVKTFEAQNNQAGKIFSFTSEDEKQLYLKNIAGAEDEYQSFYFAKMKQGNKGQPYLISLLKRNQILSSSQQLRQLIFTSGDTALSKKYDTWTGLKKQIAALYSKGDAAPKEHLKTIREKADLLEKDIVRSSSAFKKAQQNVTDWKKIQQQLQNTEAAIEFIEFNYFNGSRNTDSTYYAALVLRKGMEEPEFVTLFEKRQLDSLLTKKSGSSQGINKFYTRGLEIKRDSSLSQLAYNTIWKPLESKLTAVTKIYFAPSGLLHRIAFSALPVDSAKVLADKYQLVQVSSTAVVIEQAAYVVKPDDKIYLFGGIEYTQDSTRMKPVGDNNNLAKRSGFDYLPGTEKEVSQIAINGRAKNYSPVSVKGWDAKEDSIKVLNGKASPRILHIATHGFFFDDPEKKKTGELINNIVGGRVFERAENPLFRSGLLFAGANDTWQGKQIEGMEDDGILTAYEVSNLYLPNTKLVVLSACETALGDIKGSEGVYGLQRAFKIAGVQNLIMSLWKVPDAETSEFMANFYKEVFDGIAIDQAFYNTQNLMKNKYRNDPFKWAAWILVR